MIGDEGGFLGFWGCLGSVEGSEFHLKLLQFFMFAFFCYFSDFDRILFPWLWMKTRGKGKLLESFRKILKQH